MHHAGMQRVFIAGLSKKRYRNESTIRENISFQLKFITLNDIYLHLMLSHCNKPVIYLIRDSLAAFMFTVAFIC